MPLGVAPATVALGAQEPARATHAIPADKSSPADLGVPVPSGEIVASAVTTETVATALVHNVWPRRSNAARPSGRTGEAAAMTASHASAVKRAREPAHRGGTASLPSSPAGV